MGLLHYGVVRQNTTYWLWEIRWNATTMTTIVCPSFQLVNGLMPGTFVFLILAMYCAVVATPLFEMSRATVGMVCRLVASVTVLSPTSRLRISRRRVVKKVPHKEKRLVGVAALKADQTARARCTRFGTKTWCLKTSIGRCNCWGNTALFHAHKRMATPAPFLRTFLLKTYRAAAANTVGCRMQHQQQSLNSNARPSRRVKTLPWKRWFWRTKQVIRGCWNVKMSKTFELMQVLPPTRVLDSGDGGGWVCVYYTLACAILRNGGMVLLCSVVSERWNMMKHDNMKHETQMHVWTTHWRVQHWGMVEWYCILLCIVVSERSKHWQHDNTNSVQKLQFITSQVQAKGIEKKFKNCLIMFTFNLERCSTCSVVAHVLLLCTLEGSAYHTIYQITIWSFHFSWMRSAVHVCAYGQWPFRADFSNDAFFVRHCFSNGQDCLGRDGGRAWCGLRVSIR